MKIKSLIVAAVAAVAVAVALTTCSKVPAGNVGVKFDLYGGDKGVTGEVLHPGKYWLGWNEELYLFPTFSQNYTWQQVDPQSKNSVDESITFQDREGTQVNADVGITYAIEVDKADLIFQKYRKGLAEITDTYLRNMVRDALNSETSKMDVSDIYGVGKEELMERVTKRVRDQVKPIGLDVEKIYWIGPMRLPPAIIAAINGKIEATQKAQQRENELQTAKAQAEIEREKARGEADALLIAARSEADANKLRQASLSRELIDYTYAQRWDGKLPYSTGGTVPLLKLN